MNRYHYARGLIRCPSCEKFINPELQPEEIENSPSGHHYHAKRYCEAKTCYPARLRYQPHSKHARIVKQANATYY